MRRPDLLRVAEGMLVVWAVSLLMSLVAASVLAQGPSPEEGSPSASPGGSASPPPSPPPSCVAPATGDCLETPAALVWPRVQFLGGRADPITSSTCGIPGIDTFHLVSVNSITVDEMDVTLAPWDPAFVSAGWPGTTVGTVTGPKSVTPCFTSAWAVYDAATGVFELAACNSVSVPMSAC